MIRVMAACVFGLGLACARAGSEGVGQSLDGRAGGRQGNEIRDRENLACVGISTSHVIFLSIESTETGPMSRSPTPTLYRNNIPPTFKPHHHHTTRHPSKRLLGRAEEGHGAGGERLGAEGRARQRPQLGPGLDGAVVVCGGGMMCVWYDEMGPSRIYMYMGDGIITHPRIMYTYVHMPGQGRT
jgi:hypothetical protein